MPGAFSLFVEGGGALMAVAYPEKAQSVGQLPEFKTLCGNPLVMVITLPSCHPPSRASVQLGWSLRSMLTIPPGRHRGHSPSPCPHDHSA